MKKLQLIVYAILLIGLVMGYVEGFDTNEINAQECISYYEADYDFYNEWLYWKENNKCCKYALIDNMIEEYCE